MVHESLRVTTKAQSSNNQSNKYFDVSGNDVKPAEMTNLEYQDGGQKKNHKAKLVALLRIVICRI